MGDILHVGLLSTVYEDGGISSTQYNALQRQGRIQVDGYSDGSLWIAVRTVGGWRERGGRGEGEIGWESGRDRSAGREGERERVGVGWGRVGGERGSGGEGEWGRVLGERGRGREWVWGGGG